MRDGNLNRQLKELVQPLQSLLNKEDTIQDALLLLRQKKIEHKVIYFYVTDSDNKLVGVVSTRKLLLSHPETKISAIMDAPVLRLHERQTLKEAMELFARRGLLAIPVVNDDNALIGFVDIETYLEESFDVADSQHRMDMFQVVGLTLEDRKKVSPVRDYRFRMPWITCNMLSGIVCAIISRFYVQVLDQIVLLAMFIPLVLTLSESVSMQSMTHSLLFLRRPRVTWKYIFLKALWEEKVLFLIAATCAITIGIISLLWKGGIIASCVIGFSILISVLVAATLGFTLPILLHKSRLDPKVASGPVVLMLADVITTAIYLSLSTRYLL